MTFFNPQLQQKPKQPSGVMKKGLWLPFYINEPPAFLEQVGRLHDDKQPISVTPHNSLLAVASAPASPADESKIVPEPDTSYEKQN